MRTQIIYYTSVWFALTPIVETSLAAMPFASQKVTFEGRYFFVHRLALFNRLSIVLAILGEFINSSFSCMVVNIYWKHPSNA